MTPGVPDPRLEPLGLTDYGNEILPAYETPLTSITSRSTGTRKVVVWCRFCYYWHFHDESSLGHDWRQRERIGPVMALCSYPDSPYKTWMSGYDLRVVGGAPDDLLPSARNYTAIGRRARKRCEHTKVFTHRAVYELAASERKAGRL